MSLKSSLKKDIKQFVKLFIPEKKVLANISMLPPNEMLKGKKALITGGTSGIGYEIAKAFVRAGAKVVITGRSEKKVIETVEQLKTDAQQPLNIFGIEMDSRNPPCFAHCLDQVIGLIGSLDILVNNAGVLGGHISNSTEEKYDTVLDTNLKGAFFSLPKSWTLYERQ